SHELRTPLTSVRGYIQLLERMLAKEENEAIKTYIGKAAYQINRLNELVNDLLDISKIDSGKMEFTIRPFSIDHMLNEAIENIQQVHEQYEIIRTGDRNIQVEGDELR